MKKILLFSFSIVFSINLFSQSFDIANLRVGGGLFFATEIQNVGLALSGAYEVTEEWQGALTFTHIFEKNYVKWSMLDLDGHYIFYQPDEKLKVYGLAGLSVTFWKVTIPTSTVGVTIPGITLTGSDVGLNLGVGGNYKLTDDLNLAPEIRYTIIDGSYVRIGATLQYMF